jgi:hypothetical protein
MAEAGDTKILEQKGFQSALSWEAVFLSLLFFSSTCSDFMLALSVKVVDWLVMTWIASRGSTGIRVYLKLDMFYIGIRDQRIMDVASTFYTLLHAVFREFCSIHFLRV